MKVIELKKNIYQLYTVKGTGHARAGYLRVFLNEIFGRFWFKKLEKNGEYKGNK